MIKFAMHGATGRMGQAIARLSLDDNGIELTKVFDDENSDVIGKPYGDITDLHFDMQIEEITKSAVSDVQGIIDFSAPAATLKALGIAVAERVPLVIGTTGYTSEEIENIKTASQKIAILQATNMSLGVNLLFSLTKAASKALKAQGFDAEIVETHHKMKKDSPSGTATTLKEIIQDEFSLSEEKTIYGREGIIGERPEQQLAVMALRGGDVIGEHNVHFFGMGEKVVLHHQATSRDIFAKGAIFALKFLQNKGVGLYNMQDALNSISNE